VLDRFRLDVHVDLSGPCHGVLKPKKVERLSERPDLRLFRVRFKPNRAQLSIDLRKHRNGLIVRWHENPEIIHVPHVMPAMEPLFDVMIQIIERGNAGNLHHLRSWAVALAIIRTALR
jgi:hypothetical protein